MSAPVLEVRDLAKCYPTYASNLDRFARWFGARPKPVSEFWALRDVSFTLRHGDTLAVIGPNGAGKSTLLKCITGTVRPTAGTIAARGRVSAILELGLGFNPDLSGRQNVQLAGGLMGFPSAELEAQLPGIEAFAELGDFFDRPLQVYSSGMQARLAFSVATAVRPEVLIVDEVLSVGDSYFQHKSFARIREFKDQGTTLILVSHSMGDVRALCDRVILLGEGRAVKDGPADEVVAYYQAAVAERENAKLSIEQRRQRDGWLVTDFGTRDVVLDHLDLQDALTGESIQTARVGQRLAIESRITVREFVPRLVLGHRITDRTGHIVWGGNTWHTRQVLEDLDAGQRLAGRVEFECALGPGSYAISTGITRTDTHLDECYQRTENALVFDVVNADKPVFIGSTWLDASFGVRRL